MYLLYSLLLTAGFLLLLPRFIFDALRHGKYAEGFRERAGSLPHFDAGGRPVIWLHCVSVGETQAARPLARAILEKFPAHALVVSTTTLTGQRVAREAFGRDAALVFYFPFDWKWSARRALRKIEPSAVLIMETELWPRFFRECRLRGIPLALVNGRISEKSFRRYRLIRRFIGRVLKDLNLAAMQTEADAERLRSLGADVSRVKVSGNVKFDFEIGREESALTKELRRRFRIEETRPLLLAASTHAPEERVVLDAFKIARRSEKGRRARLLIAPRHPERFAEVSSLVESYGFSFSRRSREEHESDASCDVILLDSVGELSSAFPLAEIVFVGGSVAKVGGHNVIEPAAFGRCIVTGAHTSNFRAVVASFKERDALAQLPELDADEASQALADAFNNLLSDDERRRRVGANALAVIEENRGATAETLSLLAPLLRASLHETGACVAATGEPARKL